MLTEFSKKGIFKGKDQSLFAFHVLQHPELFECISRPSDCTSTNDEWFYLQDYFSENKQLHIVIVGPGIMPIPPTGWGAVEILIWDYAKGLERLGQRVSIVNYKDVGECISTIKTLKPDIVHIQYDERAEIAAAVRDSVPVVFITSHYGYLEQAPRWGGYSNVFYSILNQTYRNVYHAVLSEGIATVYRHFGVPDSHILVTPNGANSSLFEYTDTPKYPDCSIYLAKIDYRKRQHQFQGIKGLYFAGNVADNRFNTGSPQYLGEWPKEHLYKNLTHYGNLVLLSDGEADPLVTKEALIAGLGVVISQWSTAGLDLSKPYITVIPEDKIGDMAFVEEAIRLNRHLSIAMRGEIRRYGLEFSWDSIVKAYLNRIKPMVKYD
jgi:glycosyltransferase involved in cell wall biosynthesis